MYLHEWREGEEARTVKKVTLQNMADKFGASNGSVVRRWMLPAYDKDFNFPIQIPTVLNALGISLGPTINNATTVITNISVQPISSMLVSS